VAQIEPGNQVVGYNYKATLARLNTFTSTVRCPWSIIHTEVIMSADSGVTKDQL
jgi:hypothetical protein